LEVSPPLARVWEDWEGSATGNGWVGLERRTRFFGRWVGVASAAVFRMVGDGPCLLPVSKVGEITCLRVDDGISGDGCALGGGSSGARGALISVSMGTSSSSSWRSGLDGGWVTSCGLGVHFVNDRLDAGSTTVLGERRGFVGVVTGDEWRAKNVRTSERGVL
jgi:hypothetical protein